jgi:hypothetical protein
MTGALQVNTDFGSIFSMLLPGTTAQLQPPEGTSFLQGGCRNPSPAGAAALRCAACLASSNRHANCIALPVQTHDKARTSAAAGGALAGL